MLFQDVDFRYGWKDFNLEFYHGSDALRSGWPTLIESEGKPSSYIRRGGGLSSNIEKLPLVVRKQVWFV